MLGMIKSTHNQHMSNSLCLLSKKTPNLHLPFAPVIYNITMIKKYLFLFLSSLISVSYANSLDDWTNEDLCRWMDATLIPEHISEEIYARKVICFNDSEVIELTSQATYVSENGTVFPSPKSSAKVKPDNGFTFRINYKITL